MDTFIAVVLFVAVFLLGYLCKSKERFDTEQKYSDALKNITVLNNKIAAKNKVIDKHSENLIMKDEYLKEIIRTAESNSYGNEEVKIGKLKELAQTAIRY